MKQKINRRLIEIAVLAVLVTLVCMTTIYYGLFQKQVRKDLRIDAEVICGIGAFDKNGTGQELPLPDFEKLDMSDLRITWVDTDGTVLYDNDADKTQLENHKDRPEIAEAFKTGVGECVRNSDTMKMNAFYYAIRLDNGTVLRVSTQARSIFSVFLTSFPMIFLIIILVILVCAILAHFLTRQLLQPIEVMAENMEKMEDISKVPAYKELVPFLNTIREQHENILMAAKVRQDFTANVSHELKTPLTAISGYAELIENNMVPPEQASHFAKEIQRNSNRLLSLINDIIRLSEIDNGEETTTYESLDLNEVTRDCVGNLRVSAEQRGVTLQYEGEPCQLRANRDMMYELVDNLCENAIRYNNEGGWVCVRVLLEDSRPVLIVEDNGIGIPKDQQERIFERFYRVDKSRSKQTGGTGLGLAIVKHIVALHDANIKLESELGKGTMVRVEF